MNRLVSLANIYIQLSFLPSKGSFAVLRIAAPAKDVICSTSKLVAEAIEEEDPCLEKWGLTTCCLRKLAAML